MPESKLPPLPQDALEAERRRQQIAHIREYYGQIHRLDTVAFKLRTANRADCKDRVAAQIGLYAATPQSLPHKYRSYAREALDLTWARPTVISVVDGSPAAQAGIRVGDEVIALNGELISIYSSANWMARWLADNGVKPVRVDLRRDGVDQTIVVTPVMGCNIQINLVIADEVNAYTDGDKITIHTGIAKLAETDAQLATVVGHEMAHANLGHIDKKKMNMVLGTIGGAMVDGGFLLGGISTGGVFTRALQKVGAAAFSVGFEREADYVGAYYVARAGYDLAGTEQVWYAMGQAHPNDIRFVTTHPSSPERFLQMQKVAEEIADKRRRHLPLVPELKVVHAEAEPTPAEAIH